MGELRSPPASTPSPLSSTSRDSGDSVGQNAAHSSCQGLSGLSAILNRGRSIHAIAGSVFQQGEVEVMRLPFHSFALRRWRARRRIGASSMILVRYFALSMLLHVVARLLLCRPLRYVTVAPAACRRTTRARLRCERSSSGRFLGPGSPPTCGCRSSTCAHLSRATTMVRLSSPDLLNNDMAANCQRHCRR